MQDKLKRWWFVDHNNIVAKTSCSDIISAETALETSNEAYIENKVERSINEIIYTFQPIYLTQNCQEVETFTNRLNIYVVLPSRVEKFSVRASEDGNALKLTLKSPFPLINPKVKHKMFLRDATVRYEAYRQEYIGFTQAQNCLFMKSHDWLQSRAEIPLPYTAQSHVVDKHSRNLSDSCTKNVYISTVRWWKIMLLNNIKMVSKYWRAIILDGEM